MKGASESCSEHLSLGNKKNIVSWKQDGQGFWWATRLIRQHKQLTSGTGGCSTEHKDGLLHRLPQGKGRTGSGAGSPAPPPPRTSDPCCAPRLPPPPSRAFLARPSPASRSRAPGLERGDARWRLNGRQAGSAWRRGARGRCSKRLSSRAWAATVRWAAERPRSMRAGGADWPAELLLALGWLLLLGLQASQAANVTVTQESGVVREVESETDVDEEAENDSDVPENETPAEPEEEGEGSGSLGTGGPWRGQRPALSSERNYQCHLLLSFLAYTPAPSLLPICALKKKPRCSCQGLQENKHEYWNCYGNTFQVLLWRRESYL